MAAQGKPFFFRLALEPVGGGRRHLSVGQGESPENPIKILPGEYKASLQVKLDTEPHQAANWHLRTSTKLANEAYRYSVEFHQYETEEHHGRVIITSPNGPEGVFRFQGIDRTDRKATVELGEFRLQHGASRIQVVLNAHVQYGIGFRTTDYVPVENVNLAYYVEVDPNLGLPA